MPVVRLPLSASEVKDCKAIWMITKKSIRKEILERIGWRCMEDFLADLLRFGIDKASDDPVGFIRMIRENKDPLFAAPGKKSAPSRASTEWKKAYA